MRIPAAPAVMLPFALACGGGRDPGSVGEARLAVFGPSLVELACEGGLEENVCGVDRYTEWPPALDGVPRLGGYLDPSAEALALLDPTDVLSVGRNPELQSICGLIGAEYHAFSFDTFEDVLASVESLETGWGADLSGYRAGLTSTLDSIRETNGGRGPSVAVVIWHEPGDGMMTLAGHGTWYEGLLQRMGLSLAAPDAGTYPSVSVEGVLALRPGFILHLFPGMAGDSASIVSSEREFWGAAELPPGMIVFAFDDFMMIPGSRLPAIARRIGALCSV